MNDNNNNNHHDGGIDDNSPFLNNPGRSGSGRDGGGIGSNSISMAGGGDGRGDHHGGGGGGGGGVTELEQEVLDEYVRLATNMKTLNTTLQSLAAGPITIEIGEGLRQLEKKVASVYTLMKASVYSIVLQQGQVDDDDVMVGENNLSRQLGDMAVGSHEDGAHG